MPLTSGWRVYIQCRGRHQAGCPASRPWHLPSHSARAQTLRNTTSYILLQRGFTATPVRCWGALYGVGCLSVQAAKAVSLCVSRAPPLGMFCSMSRQPSRSQQPTPPIAGVCLIQNPYKTCVPLFELGRTSRHFIVHFEKIPTKKFPRYRRCAVFGPVPMPGDVF